MRGLFMRLETPVIYLYPPEGQPPASVPPLTLGVHVTRASETVLCHICGDIMQRAGSCHACPSCGATMASTGTSTQCHPMRRSPA